MSDRFDVPRVENYLRGRLPERSELRVDRIKRVVGGLSRQTHFVDISWSEDGSRAAQTLNLRRDHPGLSEFTVPLRWEFDVLSRLHGTSVPVAQPYWFETDQDLIGYAPFYFREVVEGESISKPLFAPGQDERRRTIGRQLALALAQLHTLDWRSLGFADFMDVPASPEECASLEVARWEKFYLDHAVEVKPIMSEVFGRLWDEIPTVPVRPVLRWGDVGIGNFIYRGNEIVALSDFEHSRIGDPMMDWAAGLTRGIQDLLPIDELVEIYETASGIEFDAERVRYYQMLHAAVCVCCHPLLEDLTGGRVADAALTRLGLGMPWQMIGEMRLGIGI